MGRTTRVSIIRAAAVSVLVLLGATRAVAASVINVSLNQALHISVGGAVTNVVVANPNIADVTVVDAHSVIVIGKGYGVSEILVTDTSGRVLLDDVVAVLPALEGLVTVHRGSVAQHFNCTPRCEAITASPSQGNGSGPGS